MKTDPNKSLAENVVDILEAAEKRRNCYGLKRWERDLLAQARRDLEKQNED